MILGLDSIIELGFVINGKTKTILWNDNAIPLMMSLCDCFRIKYLFLYMKQPALLDMMKESGNMTTAPQLPPCSAAHNVSAVNEK